MNRLLLLIITGVILLGCNNTTSVNNKQSVSEDTVVWLSDSAWYAKGMNARSVFTNTIYADIETDVVKSPEGEDAADDPAFWFNKSNPENSLILGTNKINGLHVFDINGKMTQTVECGAINNVDLRDDFSFDSKNICLVAGSNRTTNTISIFTIDKSTLKLSDTLANFNSDIDGVYGLCMFHDTGLQRYFVYVNGKNGDIEQWEVILAEGEISGKRTNTVNLGDQCEGMVADDKNKILYVGVENEGIYKLNALTMEKIAWLEGSKMSSNKSVAPDIEGLALFNHNNKQFLLASSQGNFSYAIFELGENERYITSFIIDNNKVDGVEETDGIEIYDQYINDQYPNGLLIAQDGYNHKDEKKIQQNFKYISLDAIFKLIE